MPESPMSASPYEVLGVAASASDDELRKAFRAALRRTHPDTGGDTRRFDAVQEAWARIGTTEKRAAFDAGKPSSTAEHHTFTAQAARPRKDTRPKARSYGHPGGWRREKFLAQLQEWAGRGVGIEDPYDAALVRSAPREIRHTLADALAEEATARALTDLGIGYTVWHDVSTGAPESKIDHIVLGPTGLFAILSEDFGEPVKVKRGELAGESLLGQRPMHELAQRSKALSRQVRVRFTGLVIVLPDDALEEQVASLGHIRGASAVAVRHSFLPALLRSGIGGANPIGGNELFDLRTRLTDGVRFV